MARTPDRFPGSREETEVVFSEETTDPTIEGAVRNVAGKGLVVFSDGVVRGVGESRENTWQPTVSDRAVNTPPGSPATGERVIVGDSPTGDFVGHVGEIAQWSGSAWVFTTPREGSVVYVADENKLYQQTAPSTPWVWEDATTTGGMPSATEVGQILYSLDGSTFSVVKPLVSDEGFIVTDDNGHIVGAE